MKVVPYSSVLHDTTGKGWVYTSPEPLVYVRERIDVDHIDGDVAYLKSGPKTGTNVVIIGVIELYGVETGIGK